MSSADYNDAVTVSATLTAVSGGSPLTGKTVTFVLGSGGGTETCSASTNGSGVASCSITPTQVPGPYTLTASFAGDSTDGASSVSEAFTITKEDTAVTITGPTTSDYADAVVVKAQLTDPDGGAPVSGKSLTFVVGSGIGTETCTASTDGSGNASCSITPNEAAGTYTFVLGSGAGTESCSATSDASGKATCTITPNQAAGPYSLAATFAGDAFYAASSTSTTFTITHEETATAFTASSPTVIANGHPVTFSATLLEDGTTPPVPSGQTVTFTLGTGVSAQSCNGTANAAGLATCTIAVVNQPLGPNTVSAKFAGDPYYAPSSASESVILFAFLAHGSMIVGNLDAATGTPVEFWGADWSSSNALTGGPAPDAFKGFADVSPQSCGGGWTGSPGNSSKPPATLPS